MRNIPSSVFVTGASGFIGQHLLAALHDQGTAIRAMIRPDKGDDRRLPSYCEQVPVDLTDVGSLVDALSSSSAVIYCAGSVRGRNAGDFATANTEGVRAMLDALERLPDPPPLLLVSSLAASQPGLSDYASSKFEGEQLLRSRTGLRWTILRPPAVYGPGDKEMLPVLKMAHRGLLVHAASRDQRLSLIHVDDLVRAIIAWLASVPSCVHETYAIDDGRPGGYDWTAIGEAVCPAGCRLVKIPGPVLSIVARLNLLFSTILAYAPMLTPGKLRELLHPEWLCDNKAFSAATAWKPEIDLECGARRLFSSAN